MTEDVLVSRSLVLITMVRDQGIENMKENTETQIVTTKEPQPPGCHKHHLADQGSLQVNKVCNHFQDSYVFVSAQGVVLIQFFTV